MNNMSVHTPYIRNKSPEILIQEMDEYIIHKRYKSLYGDNVPIIVARALCMNLAIVSNFGSKPECLLIKPNDDQNVRKGVYIFKKGEHYDGIIPKPISHHENASPDFTSLHWKTDGVCSYLNICTYLENACVMTNKQPSMDIESPSMSLKQRHDKSVFLQDMLDFRECNPKNLIVGHLNINGLRNKFSEIEYMLLQNTLDIFFVSETKLDESFPKHQFNVPGFESHRADRNSHGGGIMSYIRDDIPHRRRHDFEDIVKSPVENIILEAIIRNETWLFICPYNPNNKYKHVCCDYIDVLLDVSRSHPPSVIYVLGDLNINALSDSDFKCLKDVMDIHDLHNVIDSPTCFKSENKSLLDVILTSNKRRVAHTLNVNTGISDFHNLIAFSTKIQIPKTGNKYIQYRSYKKFDEALFKHDIANAPYHVGNIFDDFDDIYWYIHMLIKYVMDDHAPLKRKRTVKKPVPFMNSKLRKACHRKAMHRNKYFRHSRTKGLWNKYRKLEME